MEAAASVVGIVSFGLGLAKSLQTFVETVIEAEETIVLIVAEVHATASTLQRLQDFIEQDKAASKEQHRATVFNDTGLKEIGACASQCQRIYVQIIVLIEKASIQNGEDGDKGKAPQGSAAEDPNAPAVRLAAFSKNVTKLGRKMRWPWLEPRIKRCHEHLARLKVSLMLSLQVFLIAESRSRPFVALVSKTNDEDELRDRAETLRKKMTELQAKQNQEHRPKPRPPEFGDGIRKVSSASSLTGESSIDSGDTWSSDESINIDPADSASYSALGSTRPRRRRKSRGSRGSRALRALRAFKAYVRKRTRRRSVFKKDSTSVIFEAYLIHPFMRESLGPSSAGTTSFTPLVKLPFGHRRLTREIKRALRKFNPWDILLSLNPASRDIVNQVIQQVQAASSNMSVCLIAIDIDGYSNANFYDLDLEPMGLSWRRMVLFFRLEPVYSEDDGTEHWAKMISGPSRFTSILGNAFQSSLRANKKRKTMQARIKQEKYEKEREEAKIKAEKEILERDKAEMEEKMKALEVEKIRIRDEKEDLETQKTRIAEEKELLESRNRALRNTEKVVLETIRRGTAEKELEKVFEEERARKMLEEERAMKMTKQELSHRRLEEEHAKKAAFERAAAEKEAMERERAAAEKAKPPVKFKDAIGRKFTFPFHLVQTWQGMEDLVKQAFLHVETIGPQVQEGRYDLIDSEEQVILPSTWAETVKPGASITMRLWPMEREPIPGPHNGQHGYPQQQVHFEMEQRAAAAAAAKARLAQNQDRLRISPGAWPPSGGRVPPAVPTYGVTAGLPVGGAPPPPLKARYETVEPYTRRKKAQGIASFFDEIRGAKKSSGPKKPMKPPTGKSSKRGEDMEDIYSDELAEDIDKELGLDNLELPEQMASKDIDELLIAWTNPVRD